MPGTPSNRRVDVDWLRGVAVVLMIMWHAIDAWTIQTGRDTTAFFAIAFAAGWVAPLFLFLAGVSLSLAAESRMARGLSRRDASWTLQKRGWQVFLLAHLFRFQSFLLNPNGSWNGILKPDILNVLGLGMVFVALCWRQADSASIRSLALWLLGPATAVAAVITPLAGTWWWPSLLHPRLEAYIRLVGNNGQFSLFPATAYVFAGAFLGALMSPGAAGHMPERAFYRRASLVACGVLTAGIVLGLSPWSGSRWIGPGSIVLWRLGAMTLTVAFVWWLFRNRMPASWSPLVVFGQTSLFVYWVHVEIAYGVFTYPLRHSMTLPWSFLAYLLLVAFMFGCAVFWKRRRPGPAIPAHMTASALRHPWSVEPRSSV